MKKDTAEPCAGCAVEESQASAMMGTVLKGKNRGFGDKMGMKRFKQCWRVSKGLKSCSGEVIVLEA